MGTPVNRAPGDGATRAVLLVEDDHARAEVVLRMLRLSGYRSAHATSGERALVMVEQLKPDLVLLDASLPGIAGVEVCQRIKAGPHGAGTSVVMVSARLASDDHQADGIEAGADDYLRWPISQRALLARVALALRHRGREHVPADAPKLTPRQREVVSLLAAGQSTKGVAARLEITVRTAETHRAAIMRRLGLRSVAELVRYAVTHGLVE